MQSKRKGYLNMAGSLLLLLCAALLVLATGCDTIAAGANDSPDFNKQAEAIVLSRSEYAALSVSEQTRMLKAMDEITWYTDGGEMKLSEIGKRMGNVEAGDPSAPGSAFAAFCAVTGLNVEGYIYPAQNDPTLADALKLSINDLTGRMYSVAVPGTRVIINALYERGGLVGDAYSAANFAPMVTLQARAIVEESSGEELDYQAEGGYFDVLCQALGIAERNLYAKMEERANELLAQSEAKQTEQQAYEKEISATLPGVYTTVNGGELQINADTSYGMMYGMSFSAGGWGFEDGVLLIGGTPAYVDEDGLHIEDIDMPFVKTGEAGPGDPDGGLTSEENAVYTLLDRYHYYDYACMGVGGWYGETTDTQRVEMAQELLDLYAKMGEDVALSANEFASLINDSYDYGDRSLSVWQAACAAAGVDPAPYDDVFYKVNA